MGTVSGKHHNRLRVGHRVLSIPEVGQGQPFIGIVTELSEQSNNRVFLHPEGGREGVTVAATADRCIRIKDAELTEKENDEAKQAERKIKKRARRLAPAQERKAAQSAQA